MHRGAQRKHWLKHFTLNAIAEMRDVEVEQEAQPFARQSHVGEKLRFVNAQELLHCLDFNDRQVLCNQVESESRIEPLISVDHRQFNLPSEDDSRQLHLMTKTLFIHAFQQSRPQRRVNPHPTPDQFPGELRAESSVLLCAPSVSSVVNPHRSHP